MKKRKAIVNHTASKLFNEQMGELDNEYNKSLHVKKMFCSTYNISDLLIEDYDYSDWFVPPVGGDDELREEKGLKILTRNKLLTRFLVLLAQIKAVNYSCKLKKEISQMLYLLYQHNKIK